MRQYKTIPDIIFAEQSRVLFNKVVVEICRSSVAEIRTFDVTFS